MSEEGPAIAGDAPAVPSAATEGSATGATALEAQTARTELHRLLELTALAGVAITQPVLDVFSKSPEVFVMRRAGALDIVAFALVVATAPPAILWGLGRLFTWVGPGPRRWVHLVTVALLVGSVGAQAVKEATAMGSTGVALVAGTAAVVGVALVARVDAARLFLRYLAAAPVLFVILFLSSSPVRSVAFAGSTAAAEGVGVANRAPVVMVVLDELPTTSLLDGEGGIDRELFPNIAGLADGSTWYRNHTTASPSTPDAVPALLTGRWPSDEGVAPTVGNHEANLFTLLGDSYRLHVFENLTDLCPTSLCEQGGDQPQRRHAVRRLLRQAVDVWVERSAPRRTTTTPFENHFQETDWHVDDRFRDLRASFDDDARPSLHFLHVLYPHQPWRWLPTGQSYDAPDPPEGFYFVNFADEHTAAQARQRHLLQTRDADRQLGQILDRLRELDRYEESLVVVTADHGVSFRAVDPLRGLTDTNYPDILWTPLFIKAPGQQVGAVVDEEIYGVDVVATVADLLGVRLPWRIDGRPAGSPRESDGTRRVFRWSENELEPQADGYVHVDGEAGFAEVLSARAAEPGGDPELRLYRIPPHGDLVGVEVDDLVRGREQVLDGELDQRDALGAVDLAGAKLPVYLSGRVRTQDPMTVVAAVNGRVGAWFRNELPEDGDRRFWMLVPPSLLQEGDNAIDLFLLEGEPGDVALVPVRLVD